MTGRHITPPLEQTLATARRLVATTVPLPAGTAADLLAIGGTVDAVLWHGDGLALAGRGVALRISLPEGLAADGAAAAVVASLRAVRTEDAVGQPGCGPVALGALPFDRHAAGTLVIPAITVGRDAAGQAWLTLVGLDRPPPADLSQLDRLPQIIPPDRFSLISERAHQDWADMVAGAVSVIREGGLTKVVLAREVRVDANRRFVPADILRRLHALYPSCMIFSTGDFLGASPELLISRHGSQVRSHPLAGTVARSGDPDADGRLTDALLGSAKDREEHRLVIDAVADALRPVCSALVVPDVPSIVALRNVSHLGTLLRGTLADPDVSVLDLVARLHPTPAVGGTPTNQAVAYLQAVEGFDRRCYAGPVGWVDQRGDGEWAVAVRSAEVGGHTARLFAGVGVVADSEPEEELAETQLKLQALLAAIVRP